MPDGGTISLTIVRNKKTAALQPVVLMYNIYAKQDMSARCKEIASRGYVGIIADTRGKRLSPDAIEPFEHDAKDAFYIIDWISKQPWCNGKVAMYGGSYLGFSQWSAVKYLHPALKTIVPQVAVAPGFDYPVHNGVFMSSMLRWLHYVTNNKLSDGADFLNTDKWNNLYANWYKQGKSFRYLDTLEGRPNKIFQRWLQHPSYDSYWQKMTSQKEEFAKINIPIFTITGYWDDEQLGAMYYYHQYQQFNKNNNYYLLIGPYDHGGSQGYPLRKLAGYTIDSVANIPIMDIVFQWFDYTLKDSILPAILKDKVNFEVMGSNEWKHVTTLNEMSNDTIQFYLGNKFANNHYSLLKNKPTKPDYITQYVDLKDRNEIRFESEDVSSFPAIIDSLLNPAHQKLVFVSDAIEKPFAISGAATASITAAINKKDMDIGFDLYEQTPDGKYIGLVTNLQRASYATDNTKRNLLLPGKVQTIVMKQTYITCRQLQKGSRIIIVFGINKNPQWQVNYGTGKDVSDETMKDALIPMQIQWYNSSFISIPILR
jgi:putative CocE/NonD family hydrolase